MAKIDIRIEQSQNMNDTVLQFVATKYAFCRSTKYCGLPWTHVKD